MSALDVSKTAEMGVKWTRVFTLDSSNAVRSGYLRDSALVWGFGLLEAGADPGFLQGGTIKGIGDPTHLEIWSPLLEIWRPSHLKGPI